MTWDVTSEPASRSFQAQAISPSVNLGDQTFALSASLTLLSVADVAADPVAHQATTEPAATQPATRPDLKVVTNRDTSVDSAGRRYAMAGQQLVAWISAAPAKLFPANSQFLWEVGGGAILNYVTTKEKGTVVDLPTGPYPLSSVGEGQVKWYWTTGAVGGQSDSIQVIDLQNGTPNPKPASIEVYIPATSNIRSQSTGDKPPVDYGPTYKYPGQNSFHFGASTVDNTGKAAYSPGETYYGNITPPNLAGATGTVAFVQLVSANFSATTSTGQQLNRSTGGYVLDTSYPAKTKAVTAGQETQIHDADDWHDNPDIPVTGTPDPKITYSFHTKVYIIYKPSGDNSIYITLLSSLWQWTFWWNAPKISSNSPAPNTITSFEPSTMLPIWKGNFTDADKFDLSPELH